MDQGVEGVPNEQNAVFEGRWRREKLVGEKEGREEDEKSGEEREDCGEIDDDGRRGWSRSSIHGELELLYDWVVIGRWLGGLSSYEFGHTGHLAPYSIVLSRYAPSTEFMYYTSEFKTMFTGRLS